MGLKWPFLSGNDPFWPKMILFDPKWSLLTQNDPFWLEMTIFDPKGPYLLLGYPKSQNRFKRIKKGKKVSFWVSVVKTYVAHMLKHSICCTFTASCVVVVVVVVRPWHPCVVVVVVVVRPKTPMCGCGCGVVRPKTPMCGCGCGQSLPLHVWLWL